MKGDVTSVSEAVDALFCWIKSVIRRQEGEGLFPNVGWWVLQNEAEG